MKNSLIFALFLLVILAVLSSFQQGSLEDLFAFSYCDWPIHYRIDTVDARFDLSKNDFLSDVDDAAGIWERVYGKNLFIYDQKGDLSINLIFDERQSLSTQISQLENEVKSEKQSLNPKIQEYQKLSLEFKQKIDALNKEVEDWNNQGGAPPEEYQKLIRRHQDLQIEADNLNSMARSLNISTGNVNTQINELSKTIDSLNNALEERPEEGIFKGKENRIEIYFNINKSELIHTIAHELGHALGIKHVGNPAAIMYSKTSRKLAMTDDDLAELKEVCKRHSIFEVFQSRISQILGYFQIYFHSLMNYPAAS